MAKRMAITIAGAVSLGAFEAGVLFEVLDALDQHNAAASDDDKIFIDVLTGASAGGMTAAIASQCLLYAAQGAKDPYDNVFYNPWVATVDINGLLPLGPDDPAANSILSSSFVRRLAERFLLGRYKHQPVPHAVRHGAVRPSGEIKLGLALSNLDGVDFARPVLTGGAFNYTRFQDTIRFELDASTDTKEVWTVVEEAAVGCGAFPFAFRPGELSRDQGDYPNCVPWASSPQKFAYTDGGVFQNQPLGLAKDLVDEIDGHQDTDSRFYLFVSPQPLDPTVSDITEKKATFRLMAAALVNAVYNQAGFQDWIEAEDVNQTVSVLNRRAADLVTLFKDGTVSADALRNIVATLLHTLRPDPAGLNADRAQLKSQFAAEFLEVERAKGAPAADVWLDTVLLLELAADLHLRDEMYIYSVTADKKDLAGAGLFSFFGFLDRGFREHDYDLGRKRAQEFLTTLDQASHGKLPKLHYQPKPIHPIAPTPPDGFAVGQISIANRKSVYHALSSAADNLLSQMGVGWVMRKGIETFFLDGKIKDLLGL